MDWVAHQTANLSIGNDKNHAALEISIGGLEVLCEGQGFWAGFCGGDFEVSRNGERVPSAARLRLRADEKLRIRPRQSGAWFYLAVEGGFAVPLILGSRATHSRSSMGGLEGRMLREGDFLPVAGSPTQSLWEGALAAPWITPQTSVIRVIPGPQDDFFGEAAQNAFYGSPFTLTVEADRMAYKLKGPEIPHSRGFNIVSDGIALGAIQIGGDCQPLVLMADRQPTGGYPKIGHVARADIDILAQMRPGAEIRFEKTTVEEARARLLGLEDEIAKTQAFLSPLKPELTSEHLLSHNLISGVFNAREES
jgi:biotin-dependent carboxylase-like uncharacterized protein